MRIFLFQGGILAQVTVERCEKLSITDIIEPFYTGWSVHPQAILSIPGVRESLLSWCYKSEHVQRGFPLTLVMQESDKILNRKENIEDWNLYPVLRKTESIGDRIARYVLRMLDWEHRKKTKGMYTDGRRRPDLDYHMHAKYVPGANSFKQYMGTHEGVVDIKVVPVKALTLPCSNLVGTWRGTRMRKSTTKQTVTNNLSCEYLRMSECGSRTVQNKI